MKTALLMTFLATAVSGCAAHLAAAPTAPVASTDSVPPAQAEELKAAGEAKVGDRTRCAVSGDVFTVEADSPKAEYQGKTYFFCCDSCVDDFKADPARYLTTNGKP